MIGTFDYMWLRVVTCLSKHKVCKSSRDRMLQPVAADNGLLLLMLLLKFLGTLNNAASMPYRIGT